ncbi:MAG: TIGR03862 family flavoprotein [Paracoccaceae bacterium]
MPERPGALVVGAGPAGLMAAEALSLAGRLVVVAEARPSIGRKFLMAGRSGLNLTKDEPPGRFATRFDADWLAPALSAFGPAEAMAWARGLGVAVFTGSSGRVFPVGMKASPLLRAWAARLAAAGVELRTRWRWTGWEEEAFRFDTPEGTRSLTPGVTVLALGGGSWARLGSDGTWAPWLQARGVPVAPFRPANMGFRVDWSAAMQRFFGMAVKAVALTAGAVSERGELVLSARGIEGGGVYAVAAAVRDGAALNLDLLPGITAERLAFRLAAARPEDSAANRLRKAAGMPPVKAALLREWGGLLPRDPGALAVLIKALPVRHAGPRPIDEAISTAGGVMRSGLTDDLELKALPGVFAAGEMLDWEAPTGGYLITACLATGLRAGRAAAARG